MVRPIRIESLAKDEKTKLAIEEVLESVWEKSGGIAMLQDLATLGHVFGHVDLLMRVDEENLVGAHVDDASQWISIEADRCAARGCGDESCGLSND